MSKYCQQPQAHPHRCGCQYDGTNGNGYQPTANNELPLLPSERRAYEMKIREAVNHADSQWNAALRYVNRILLEDELLTNEDKDRILSKIWRK